MNSTPTAATVSPDQAKENPISPPQSPLDPGPQRSLARREVAGAAFKVAHSAKFVKATAMLTDESLS